MTMTVLQDTTVNVAALQAELAAVKAELAKKQALRFKVAEKGGISVYGINNRFPVTLYAEQWERLGGAMPALLTFCKTNGTRR
jgi:hypothetical protein